MFNIEILDFQALEPLYETDYVYPSEDELEVPTHTPEYFDRPPSEPTSVIQYFYDMETEEIDNTPGASSSWLPHWFPYPYDWGLDPRDGARAVYRNISSSLEDIDGNRLASCVIRAAVSGVRVGRREIRRGPLSSHDGGGHQTHSHESQIRGVGGVCSNGQVTTHNSPSSDRFEWIYPLVSCLVNCRVRLGIGIIRGGCALPPP